MSYIKLEELAGCNIPNKSKIELMAQSIEWLAVAWAMVTIHQDRAAKKLLEMGCPIRFNDDDDVVIWWDGT